MLAIISKYLRLVLHVHLHPVLCTQLQDPQGRGSYLFHRTGLFPDCLLYSPRHLAQDSAIDKKSWEHVLSFQLIPVKIPLPPDLDS